MQKHKIKICHVASVDMTIKFLLANQLKFLLNEGYDVYAVCSDGKWVRDIEKSGVKVKTITIKRKISPLYDIVTLFRLWSYFRKEKFDIVHTHTPKPGLLGQLAAKLAGVPIVINTIHGLYFNSSSSFAKKRFFIIIEKIAATCSSLIFSQSREDVKTLTKFKIAKPEVVKYLGNGVDVEKFNPGRFSEEFIKEKKRKLKIPLNIKIIATVGRLVMEKGYRELFLAFKKVLEEFPKTLLLVIGPEDLEKKDSFKPDVAKEHQIEQNVLFLGERTDLDELYSVIDVFVLASHREGFPRTLIEAMAMQKAVVATDIRGCNEAVKIGENGILVPVKEPVSLAKAISSLLDDPAMADRLAENARLKAEKEFDERLVFDRIKKEYDRLIKEKIR